jgi:hypothetical protein
LDIKLDQHISLDDLKTNFKGMHVISTDFEQNTLTGGTSGKGKVKLRVTDQQMDTINKRLSQTPSIKSTKIDEDSNRHNKKLD